MTKTEEFKLGDKFTMEGEHFDPDQVFTIEVDDGTDHMPLKGISQTRKDHVWITRQGDAFAFTHLLGKAIKHTDTKE